ncbi:hypothetical protein TRFO_10355 [Tritrichomonas foetus]|uniref:Uncharacterized protein n=1 Tax=Tritrichomonas foetus TaxID=1144522 RepID=A0A1J4JAL6_9EUKA|nr:hypothetical protein TRFO_10355 [Tritrichomonas foetus]|eukprot:OHS95713.1 hypothetical protein TRFO_10355 [Tritrichomonas foetus]
MFMETSAKASKTRGRKDKKKALSKSKGDHNYNSGFVVSKNKNILPLAMNPNKSFSSVNSSVESTPQSSVRVIDEHVAIIDEITAQSRRSFDNSSENDSVTEIDKDDVLFSNSVNNSQSSLKQFNSNLLDQSKSDLTKNSPNSVKSLSRTNSNATNSSVNSNSLNGINGDIIALSKHASIAEFRTNIENSLTQSSTNLVKLPDDYSVPKNALDIKNTALLTYVDHLLPLPYMESSECELSNIILNSLEKQCDDIKSFSWTIRQVILVFRNGFEVDSFAHENVSFSDIIKNMLMKSGKNAKIVGMLQDNLIRSISYHSARSNTIQFFMQFLMNEYSIIDFRFFTMLFSLCFPLIYPEIDPALEDPDLVNDFHIFLIHKSFFDKICSLMLRIDKFPDDRLANMMKENSKSEYPDLLSFWEFAKEMMFLFKKVHLAFHQQIKSVMKIIGSNDHELLTRTKFTEFLRIVEPLKTEDEIKSMWDKMLLFGSGPDQIEVEFQTFIKFCGDFPSLTESIISLPRIENFDKKFSALPEPCSTLFFFMRKRYSDLLPRFFKALPSDIRENLVRTIFKMRNTLLRCDVGSTLVFYRHFMQLIDLKMTEINPYHIITTNLTSDDVGRIINHVMMRECLASIMLDIKPEVPITEIVSREVNFQKK